MKIKRDQVTGLALVILGIVLMVLISQFKKPITAEVLRPFEVILGFLFMAKKAL